MLLRLETALLSVVETWEDTAWVPAHAEPLSDEDADAYAAALMLRGWFVRVRRLTPF